MPTIKEQDSAVDKVIATCAELNAFTKKEITLVLACEIEMLPEAERLKKKEAVINAFKCMRKLLNPK